MFTAGADAGAQEPVVLDPLGFAVGSAVAIQRMQSRPELSDMHGVVSSLRDPKGCFNVT